MHHRIFFSLYQMQLVRTNCWRDAFQHHALFFRKSSQGQETSVFCSVLSKKERRKKRKHHTTPSKLVVCNEKSQVYSDPVFLSFGLAENLCQPSPLRPPSVQITCSRKLSHLTSRGMKMRLQSMINVDAVKIKVGINSMSILQTLQCSKM